MSISPFLCHLWAPRLRHFVPRDLDISAAAEDIFSPLLFRARHLLFLFTYLSLILTSSGRQCAFSRHLCCIRRIQAHLHIDVVSLGPCPSLDIGISKLVSPTLELRSWDDSATSSLRFAKEKRPLQPEKHHSKGSSPLFSQVSEAYKYMCFGEYAEAYTFSSILHRPFPFHVRVGRQNATNANWSHQRRQ